MLPHRPEAFLFPGSPQRLRRSLPFSAPTLALPPSCGQQILRFSLVVPPMMRCACANFCLRTSAPVVGSSVTPTPSCIMPSAITPEQASKYVAGSGKATNARAHALRPHVLEPARLRDASASRFGESHGTVQSMQGNEERHARNLITRRPVVRALNEMQRENT